MNRIDFLYKVKNLLPPNPVCLEVGVLSGEFSSMINEILVPSKLHLIDPWDCGSDKSSKITHYDETLNHSSTAYSRLEEYELVQSKFQNEISSGIISLHKGFSYDFSNYFDNFYFDFIYIDACHLYDCVKSDLEIFFPTLKQKGLMCGHDYFHHSNFGVVEAVDEFCNAKNFNLLFKSNENDWATQS